MSYSFDTKGNLTYRTDNLTAHGYLTNVSDNQTGKVYWTATTMNARGQMTQSLYGNGMQTTRTYDPVTGLLKHINTNNGTITVQDWEYLFDALGNLKVRTDDKRGFSETFNYDNLNRLLDVSKNNVQTLVMTYDELGNILTKSDVGEYKYEDLQRPHSVTGITPYAGGIFNATTQRINYTSFDKVRTIAQGTDSLILNYGPAYQRIYGDTYQNNVLKKRRVYVNSLYEQEKDYTTGKVKETFYIFGGDGMVAIRVNDATGDNVSYVHKDHLGSIQCLTTDAGALAQEMSYDAWGNRRDPNGWSVYANAPAGLITDRGFTGHEHIDLFDLVNMDGRVYDPVIGRFLSADPVIQDPENLQSLNRYSYCMNNPLSLSDPSGYSWLSDNWRSLVAAGITIAAAGLTALTMGAAAPLLIATIAGGVGGFAGGFAGTLLNGGNLGQALVAGVVGGLIGAATGFLSYAAGGVEAGISKTGAIFERAAKHAFADMWMGGVKSAVYGGEMSPVRDMIGGAVTSAANELGDIDNMILGTATSAAVGGTISEIGGGKFANGAVTGAYNYLYNKWLHSKQEASIKQKINSYLNNVQEAANMTLGWLLGDNSEVMYANNDVTNALKNSLGVEKAYNDYLKTGKNTGSYDFGINGLINAGSDPIQQFVGSYQYRIYNNDGNIQFTIMNITSFASAAYHLWPYKWNWNNGPMSNFKQTYIFTYP